MSNWQAGKNIKSLNLMQKAAAKLYKMLNENAHNPSHLCVQRSLSEQAWSENVMHASLLASYSHSIPVILQLSKPRAVDRFERYGKKTVDVKEESQIMLCSINDAVQYSCRHWNLDQERDDPVSQLKFLSSE